MSEQTSEILSEQIEIFCNRLEVDGISNVTLHTIRTKWIPPIAQREADNAALQRQVEKAIELLGR